MVDSIVLVVVVISVIGATIRLFATIAKQNMCSA